ncbi:Ger(x)C family spore germination protein [Paenibacillus thalictri]|uniref:Ger(X)C family spore germination protein n=1 Tax=Paenibacillus thalictri TaxID=2527873 RepID=A0A4Q9DHA4_9BACL|nr:Ger(x)C family spore germination protein [Paenibacillus thalictri]TBL71219.1 Ger(x)C family spore germination protein [Paenibacillus thalictri]
MKRLTSLLAALLTLGLTAGCWDNNELDEYGYVQAVAIDRDASGVIGVTTHFYNPASKMNATEGIKAGQKGINIRTSGETFFEAIRDIPTEFGRKAKWDHMRVILLGEELAKTENIREVLDFFSRDHEPRGTVMPMIAEKEAGPFLNIQPFIEQTIGQQFKKMETTGTVYSADTSSIPLYEMAIQLKSPSKTAVLPYLHRNHTPHRAVVSGVALIRDGKLVDILDSPDTESFMMLTGRYRSGVIEFPCLRNGNENQSSKESLEVLTFQSSMTPLVEEDHVSVHVQIRIEGTVGELRCSHLKTKNDVARFEKSIKEKVERQLQHTVAYFKQQEVDAIGIANQIYRNSPKLWKRLEPDWGKHFAQSEFHIDVTVKTLNTGLNVGTPFGTKEK